MFSIPLGQSRIFHKNAYELTFKYLNIYYKNGPNIREVNCDVKDHKSNRPPISEVTTADSSVSLSLDSS